MLFSKSNFLNTENCFNLIFKAGITCLDDGCIWVHSQQAQLVEVRVVHHGSLKFLQRQSWFEKLPITVIWEVIVNEESWVSQKIKLVVSGRRRKR